MSGAGSNVLLLPPGASGASAWRGVSEHLASRARTIALNHSGYGHTDSFHQTRPLTLDDEVDAAFAVLTHVGSPVHLVGHSFGGAVALRLAVRHPDALMSLTLIEPAAYWLLDDLQEPALSQEVATVNRRFLRDVQRGDLHIAFRNYLAYYNDDDAAFERLPERAQQRLMQLSNTVAAALTAVHMDSTSLDDWRRLQIPTQLVHGALTDPMHARLTQALARERPETALHTVAAAKHLLTLTHPAETAELLERFTLRHQ